MTATFGDFLQPAGQHIAAAVAFRGDLPDDVWCVAVRELGRLVFALAGCFDDLPLPHDLDPAAHRPPSLDTQAVAGARIALRRAARSLRHRTTTTEDAHPVVRHLSAAADHLAAGRDLLQTHFATAPSGARTGTSYWAPAITSRPMTAALLGEIAEHARTLAPWASQLTMTGPIGSGMPAPERRILHSAIGGLWITAAAVEAAQRRHPSSDDARRLLAAIPSSFPPPRRPPGDGEPVTQLCEGIAITAERLRHAALAPARRSPPAMSASWRRGALASAITSHASEIILRTLAERASQLGTDPGIRARLHTAADAMSLAWPAWRGVACEWDILSTGAHAGSGRTAAAADFGDLVLRAGRLAYASPHWTPACASPVRAAADLAPTGDGIPIVVAAVHHAADAISRVGIADHQAVRTTAGLGRLYLPTRLMPEGYDIPYRYTRASGPRTDALLAMYVTATSVSALVTEVLDDLAAAIDAPSTVLGARRNFENPQPGPRRHEPDRRAEPAAEPGAPPQAAQIERVLHSLQITESAMLLRAAAIDQAGSDLLAEASAKSRSRDSLTASPAQPVRQARARAVRVASNDLPRHMPNRDQQPSRHDQRTPALPATATPARPTTTLSRTGNSRSR